MLKKLIDRSARKPLLVVILIALLAAAGLVAAYQTPVDALPDLSDAQVIIRTDFPGQAPQIVEDQVTYPLTSALLAVPRASTVRGFSMVGTSFVYVIFEEGTDLYWARSRVLEHLSQVQDRLPAGARASLGPDATGVGWVYQYSLRDTTGTYDLAQLRAIQDFYLKFELQSVKGVAEIASIGGFEKQYQVVVDPQRLDAWGVTLQDVVHALDRSNRDVGARLLELGEREVIVRGRGYLNGVDDIANVVVRAAGGVPVTVSTVADVRIGPEQRRGIVESNGQGEVVGGIVVMRAGENAQAVIDRVRRRLTELKSGLPPGVEVATEYDRTKPIQGSIDTLRKKLAQQFIVVVLVVLLFLLHARSAFVALISIPVGVLISLLVMRLLGISANVMSLGGIAISIGVMVDASLVMVENAHKHLERLRMADAHPGTRAQTEAVIAAAKEVGPSLFFSLLIVTVSFLPIFALGAQEGRLFRPLALTKTFAMAAAAGLAVTLIPPLMVLFVKGRIRSESANPLNRFLRRMYRPVVRFSLRRRTLIIAAAAAVLLASILPIQRFLLPRVVVPFPQLGSEFIPPFWEGDIMYMPVTLPGVSPAAAARLLQHTDRIIASFPEVERVYGKAGRAETATDPAPLNMLETTVILKPERDWRPGVSRDSLIRAMDAALRLPGLSNSWVMPIRNRIDMLATGIRTPIGIKIAGDDLGQLEAVAEDIEGALRGMEGLRSVIAERVRGGSYLNVDVRTLEAARYGLTEGDVLRALSAAVGGTQATETVEGLERYSVLVRYPRMLRDDLSAIRQVRIPTPTGARVPLGDVATLRLEGGPSMIKSENARLNAWVFVDLRDGVDAGTAVARAQARVAERVSIPAGVSIRWSGQHEYMQRAADRLRLLVPLTVAIVFLLLLLHLGSPRDALLLMLPLPFALVGAVWLLAALGYNMSVAVAVGMIAVVGLAVETGIIMYVFLDESVDRFRREGRLNTAADLLDAIEQAATDRLRPVLMTVLTSAIGLLPIMFGTSIGSEVMRRIAAPMVGGLATAAILTLVVIPAIYSIVHGRELPPPRRV